MNAHDVCDISGLLHTALKVRRVFAFWTEYLAWASEHFPEVLPTLNGPASEQQLHDVENDIQRPLPDALRLLYRFHAGQVCENALVCHSRFTPRDRHIWLRLLACNLLRRRCSVTGRGVVRG